MTNEKNTVPATPSRFPSAVDILAFLGIFFVGTAVGGFAAWISGLEMPSAEFNAVQYAVSMSVTLAGVLFYRFRRRAPKVDIGLSFKGFNPLIVLWGVLFMAAIVVVMEPLLAAMPEVPDAAYGRGFWTVVTVVVMAPLFEEFIFRGILLESLRIRYGVFVAWILSSVIFGLVHLHPTIAVNAAVMGLVLGFIYIATRSLWASIALHAANNAVSYVLLASGKSDLLFSEIIADKTLYWLFYGCVCALLAVSGFYLVRLLRRCREEDKNREIAATE